MRYLHTILALFLFVPAFADSVACPTTDTSTSLVAVHGISAPDRNGRVWYGTEELAVLVTVNGHWLIQSTKRNYFDKLWWWRKGYVAMDDPYPELKVTARRLDGDAAEVKLDWTTNALSDEGDLMLNGPMRVWTYDDLEAHFDEEGIVLDAQNPRDAIRTAMRSLDQEGIVKKIGRGRFRPVRDHSTGESLEKGEDTPVGERNREGSY